MTQEKELLFFRFMVFQMELEKKMKQKGSSWQEELFSKNVVNTNDGKILQFPFPYTRDKMLECLMRETVDFGRAISFAEFSRIPGVPQPNEYARYGWTSFDEAAVEAWQKLQGPIRTRLTEEGEKLRKKRLEHPTAPTPTQKSAPTPTQKPIIRTGPIPRFD